MTKDRKTLVAILLAVWLAATLYLSVTVALIPEPRPCPPLARKTTPAKRDPGEGSGLPSKRPLFPRYAKRFTFTVDFFGIRYEGLSDNLIDRHILHLGAYEKDVLFFMRDALRRLCGTKKGVFVDVGANTGQHALFMSKHAAAVHAFEPFPPVLARFRAALKANAIDNIVIHPVGLGSKTAKVPFNAPPEENLGSGSFVADYQPGNRPVGELSIVRGDDALKASKVARVDMIKMDIEGYEKPALAGLKATLARDRPTVVVEVTFDPRHAQVFKTADELRAAFPERYRFARFVSTLRAAATGRYRIVPFEMDFSFRGQRMLVVYPQERAKTLDL